jgi:hypothetical protein
MISEFSSNFSKLPVGRQGLIDLLLLPALDSHWLEYLKFVSQLREEITKTAACASLIHFGTLA